MLILLLLCGTGGPRRRVRRCAPGVAWLRARCSGAPGPEHRAGPAAVRSARRGVNLKQELEPRGKETKGHQDMLEFASSRRRAGIVNRIRCSFYRGNDERSPGSFTAATIARRPSTCRCTLNRARGPGRRRPARADTRPAAGDRAGAVHRRRLLRRCDNEQHGADTNRARHSARAGGRRRQLMVLRKGRRLEVTYPLGTVTEEGLSRRAGCSISASASAVTGGWCRASVTTGSSMSCTSRTARWSRNETCGWAPSTWYSTLRGPRLREWFSHEPIPVLPHKNTDDPKLLGLDVHQAP